MLNERATSRTMAWSQLEWRDWRWWYFLIGVAAFVVGTSVPTMLGVDDVVAQHLQFSIYIVIAVAVPAILARGAQRADYGLQPAGWLRVLVVAALTYIVFSIAVRLWTASGGGGGKGGGLLAELNMGATGLRDAALILSICVVGPVAEEFIFRGLFFRSLRDGVGRWRWMPKWLAVVLATLLSSYLFVTIHGGGVQDSQLYMLMLMGVLYALAYEVSGSLYAPVLAHVLNNTVAVWRGLDGKATSALPEPAWMGLLVAAPALAIVLTWLIGKGTTLLPASRARRLSASSMPAE